MTLTLTDDLLKLFFFKNHPLDQHTSKAKFWNLPEVPTLESMRISGDVNLVLSGKSERFAEGAFVYKNADGSLAALQSKSAWGGGITTLGGRPIIPTSREYGSYKTSGNFANLQYDKRAGRLTLLMPEGQIGGVSFSYPGYTHQELAAKAESKGAVMQVRDKTGKIYEGFLAEGKGAVLPSSISGFHNGLDIKGGEFISFTRSEDGAVKSLHAYKPYTAKEIEQITSFGPYCAPGNNLADLTTLDGKPLLERANPVLNVETGEARFPWLAAEEKGLAGSLARFGKRAGLWGAAIVGTAAVVAGVEYLFEQAAAKNGNEETGEASPRLEKSLQIR